MKPQKPDSLLFDLDGTLWDASVSCARSWNASLAEIGFTGAAVDEVLVRSISGQKTDKALRQCFPFLPEEKQAALLSAYQRNEPVFLKRVGGVLYPHVRKTLRVLRKDCGLFIISNCLAGYVETFLSLHNLWPFFVDFECSGNTGLTKSENIRLLMGRNGLLNPVYVGDTVWDQEAAKEAAIPFVHAAYGFGTVPNADRLETFADLPALLLQGPADAKSFPHAPTS